MPAFSLKFGSRTLSVEIPSHCHVDSFSLGSEAALPDPEAAVHEALADPIGSAPLESLAQGRRRDACIVISDLTRPVPNAVVLRPILHVLERMGIPRQKILILIATGIHRPNEDEELVELVGPDIARHYRIENHISRNPQDHVEVDRSDDGHPLEIDRRYVEADLKIITGLIEPHLMAGYSGGRKSILPGLASVETMRFFHSFAMIQQDRTSYGRVEDNPCHHASRRVAKKAGVDFMLNVAVDAQHRLTAVFAGDLDEAFAAGVAHVRKQNFIDVEGQYDVVVTTGGGAPLDRTLYQSWKGVVGALGVVRKGGSVVVAAENAEGAGSVDFLSCFDGLQDPRDFFRLAPEPGYFKIDQWMAQEICNAAVHANLYYHATGLTHKDLERFFVIPVDSPGEGVRRALGHCGPNPRVLVLPDGPYLVPISSTPSREIYDWYSSRGGQA